MKPLAKPAAGAYGLGMNRFRLFSICFLTVVSLAQGVPMAGAADWPWWRGPTRDGVAPVEAGQEPPTEFGSGKNVRWATPLPGRAHGSACVVGERVYIATAVETGDGAGQAMVCLERRTGAIRWQTQVHAGGLTQKINKKASWASGTPACDGERVYINFLNGDAVHTTALDLKGRIVWQTRLTNYVEHQGYGSSPAIHGSLVIVSADNKAGGVVAGLDRKTGAFVWKVDRPKLPNYASPVVLTAAGREQLFLTGADKVSSHDPMTGKVLWEIAGATTECVTTTPTDGARIFTSGGYPKNHVAAVAADGSGRVVWELKERVYVPSMLIRGGHLFAVLDSGVAACWDSATGAEKWKARLGGNYSGSPTMAGDLIYVGSESGTVYVFKASTAGLEVVAENPVGGEIYSTPSICGGEIFLRVADYQGETRSETLYCFGK